MQRPLVEGEEAAARPRRVQEEQADWDGARVVVSVREVKLGEERSRRQGQNSSGGHKPPFEKLFLLLSAVKGGDSACFTKGYGGLRLNPLEREGFLNFSLCDSRKKGFADLAADTTSRSVALASSFLSI